MLQPLNFTRLQSLITVVDCHAACDSANASLSSLKHVDWQDEARLISISIIGGLSICFAINFLGNRHQAYWEQLLDRFLLHTRVTTILSKLHIIKTSSNAEDSPRRRYVCGPSPRPPPDTTRRTRLLEQDIEVFAWPSKGGVIILENADAVDLDFLGLERMNPAVKRLDDQAAEDMFCQRMLRLGAKWWPSEARYDYVTAGISPFTHLYDSSARADSTEESLPTLSERRWVSVGWPSTGGFWIAEFDKNSWGEEEGFEDESEDLALDSAARLKLACTMDEKCEILRKFFNATFYADLRDYKGPAMLNAWAERALNDGDDCDEEGYIHVPTTQLGQGSAVS